MKLVVGLGNPGPRYETTRHNVGFLAIDQLVDFWNARSVPSKVKAEQYEARIQLDGKDETVLLMKPQTFMNLSGQAAAPVAQFHQLEASDIVVIHDEVDLTPLTLRFKTGGGTGGHNGLKSMDQSLGAAMMGYHRIRLGVGHPRMYNLPMDAADWVLGQIPDSELNQWADRFKDVEKALKMILSGKMKEAMNQFHAGPAAQGEK